MPASVVIVYEHAALREGLKLLLSGSGIDVRGATGDSEVALDLVEAKGPDVALIDLDLGGRQAPELVSTLLEQSPEVKILLYCSGAGKAVFQECIEKGSVSCISKVAGGSELVKAIDEIMGGRRWLDRRFAAVKASRGAGKNGKLSAREREVLTLLAEGQSGSEVAKSLWLSPETVRTHVRNAMAKLGAKTRVHAVSKAINSGQIPSRDSSA